MDGPQFDRLARLLAAGATRRTALVALLGLAALPPGAAAHRPRRRGGPELPTPGRPRTFLICHKPGTPAQRTLVVGPRALAGHLVHRDRRGPCCPEGHAECRGACCPPPPQGGRAACCPDGSCACAGECCRDACFYDDLDGDEPALEFCCVPPEWEVCLTREGPETCCPRDEFSCACADSGALAGTYRRPGR